MKNNFYIGKGIRKGAFYTSVIIGFFFGFGASSTLWQDGNTGGAIVAFLLVTPLIMSLFSTMMGAGFSPIQDCWFIEDNTIYYFKKKYYQRRYYLALFLKSDRYLMKNIEIKDIINIQLTWSQKPCPPYGVMMYPTTIQIKTKDNSIAILDIGLNYAGTTETGEALRYLENQTNLKIKGAGNIIDECLLVPDMRLFDYVDNLIKEKKSLPWTDKD